MSNYNKNTSWETIVRDLEDFQARRPKVNAPEETSNITCIAGNVEMLKVASDGFYIRGVKVPQDDKEAETVYNAFKSFLMWAELNKR